MPLIESQLTAAQEAALTAAQEATMLAFPAATIGFFDVLMRPNAVGIIGGPYQIETGHAHVSGGNIGTAYVSGGATGIDHVTGGNIGQSNG